MLIKNLTTESEIVAAFEAFEIYMNYMYLGEDKRLSLHTLNGIEFILVEYNDGRMKGIRTIRTEDSYDDSIHYNECILTRTNGNYELYTSFDCDYDWGESTTIDISSRKDAWDAFLKD